MEQPNTSHSEFSIVEETAMPSATDRAIRNGLCASFPNDADVFAQTRAWHGSAPTLSVVRQEGPLIVAHVGIVVRTIAVGLTNVTIAGVQNVFVLPSHRGTGLVDRLMTTAMREAGKRKLECGLLFCLPVLQRVYARTGWVTLPTRPIYATSASNGRYLLEDKNVLMFHPLSRTDFPAHPIDLRGDDW
jgi:predicted N-acetyltransferase YhbS